MSKLTINSPVGSFVTENQFSTAILNKYGLDFCCGGKQALDQACADKGLNAEQIFGELQATNASTSAEHVNWEESELKDLAQHILDTHHVYVKQELPRISELVNKVASVYALKAPFVTNLQLVWQALHDELAAHLQKEEQVLFPRVLEMCAAEQGTPLPAFHCGSVNSPINVMEVEHENAGEALRKMRELTSDYQAPEDACTTFKLMYQGLEAFEADLHQHVHKENNILFPKVLELEQSLHA